MEELGKDKRCVFTGGRRVVQRNYLLKEVKYRLAEVSTIEFKGKAPVARWNPSLYIESIRRRTPVLQLEGDEGS